MASRAGKTIEGGLLDVQMHESEGKSIIEVYIRTPEGVKCFEDPAFPPYFYISLDKSAPASMPERLEEESFTGGIKLVSAKKETRGKKEFIRLSFARIPDLLNVRDVILNYPGVENRHEYNIPYTRRYLLDKKLVPNQMVKLELDEKNQIKKIISLDTPAPEWRVGAFDIETYGIGKGPDPKRDEIISIAIASPAGNKVFMREHANKHTTSVKDEKALLNQLTTFLKLADLDVICTYNGDGFDFPFVHERATQNKANIDWGFGIPQLVTKGSIREARVKGMQHVDVYQLARLLSRFQALKTLKLDLGSVMQAVFGEGEKTMNHKQIQEAWKTKTNLEKLALYNLNDAIFTQRLANEFLPLLMELSKIVRQPLYDTSRSTASQLVESVLFNECVSRTIPIPNPPTDEQVSARNQNPIEGGYVKEPVAGLHEHVAVLDFRSLYPSIMISHNISPDTLDCSHAACKKGANLAPTDHWFCLKEKGLVSSVMETILNQRIEVQKQMDALDKNDPKMKALKARKQALKILLNSFFGTLAYPRFRWYSRETARAITAWSRHYIRKTLQWAEEEGLTPVYGDTDSAFILVPKEKEEKDVRAFVKKVNAKLPGIMELEFEGMYQRGIFVTKKEGHAAKKRYALADYEGGLTIVGLEYVRRDWSRVARETQKKVLEEVLVNGKPDAALKAVQEMILALRGGKVPKKDLIVHTQLQRRPESYANTNPHVSAAQKAIARGKEIHVGDMLGFVITQKGKTISEKAELEEFVKEGDYDAEYYINNQVVPAIERIFVELGYDPKDLRNKGKQTGLGAFV